MNHSIKNIVVLPTTLLLALMFTSIQPSDARGGGFKQNHPRRSQVMHRDRNLNNQINQDRGQLGGHYNQLESRDQSIQQQEQRDSRINGGFITKGQQQHLDGEENRLHRHIRNDYTGGPSTGTGGGPTTGTGGGPTVGTGGGPTTGTGGGPTVGTGGGPVSSTGGSGGNGGGGGGNGGGNGNFAKKHPRRHQVLSEDRAENTELSNDKGNLGGNYGQLEQKDQSIRNQEQRDARINGGFITNGQERHLDNEETHLQRNINKDYQ